MDICFIVSVCVGSHMPSTHVEDRAHVHESVPSSPMWTPGVAQSPALSAAVLTADPLTGRVGTF